MRRPIRGFTLIELLITLAIGSLALVAAAQLASIGVQAAGRGEQHNELVGRMRLVGGQLRSDLGHAGYGSNGTIAVDPARFGYVGMSLATSANGRQAIPVMRSLNNVPAGLTIGGIAVQPGSDIIQVVVADPDPTRVRRIALPIDATFPVQLPVAAFPGGDGCQFLYAVDHASPNGAGRTQLLRYTPGASPVPLLDAPMFPLPQGTEIHCARVSTYWVDTAFQLHRSDLDPTLPPLAIGVSGLFTTIPAPPNTDVIAPGVADLQIAYTFSRVATLAGPNPAAAAYTSGIVGGFVPNMAAWTEVRSVRYTLVGRSLRQVENPGDPIEIPRYEDRVPGSLLLSRMYTTQVIAGGAELTNLRYFDEQTEANVVAEPY